MLFYLFPIEYDNRLQAIKSRWFLSCPIHDLQWENTQLQIQTSQMSNLASMIAQTANKNPRLFNQPAHYFVLWASLFGYISL